MKVAAATASSAGGLHAAAIVVLGARVRPDGRPSAALERRMRVAIALYQAGVAPRLLLSGGGRQAMPEAEVMRQLALAAGIPDSALLIEPRSRTTLENATETARLLSVDGPRTVVLVTDSYHALRARLLFRIAGVAVLAVQTAAVPMRVLPSMIVAESVKLPVNLVRAVLRKRR